ncbi:MAG: enoyl-CoA hydratase [Pseudomonadota bacterium]
MSYSEILYDAADSVATITLNRPDRLNAWTGTMAREMRAAVHAAGTDPDVRAIIVTGAGRGFCAGADMDALEAIGDDAGQRDDGNDFPAWPEYDAPGPSLEGLFPGRFGYLYACPKPIIAAINGPCAGIGLIMTLYCDMRFAAEEAKFTTAFAARGLIAEHGISWLLPRLVGEAHAFDLLLSARKFLGAEAAELGLVNKAMPAEDVLPHAQAVATQMVSQSSPRSMAIMKAQMRRAYFQSYEEALTTADAEMLGSFDTHDFREGVESFVERRPPAFKGI